MNTENSNELREWNETNSGKHCLYQAIVESACEAIITESLDGTITSWNPAAERLYGYEAKEAIGENISMLIPGPANDASAITTEVFRMGQNVDQFETVRKRKDGQLIHVSVSITPIRDGSGRVIGAAKISRDITARKQAEIKIRMAVESCPSGMVMVDTDGIVLLVNTATERMFGYNRQELIGQSIDMLVPMRFRFHHTRHREAFQVSPETRKMGVGRDPYGLRKNGEEFPIEIGLSPITTPEGLCTLSVITDISDRKAAEQAMAAKTRDLQRSNAELEQFAYVASHDLQEPLRMVASYTELLGERYKGQLDEKADKYIHYAVEGARRMQELVSDLLTYSRVGTQGKPFQPVDAGEVVKRVLTHMTLAIEKCGAEITIGKLPTIDADEVQLGQVFQNLIGNSIKFRADRPPRVRIDAVLADDEWIFSIEDNGIGIKREYAGRVFQMFQRLHGRDKYDGSGIGLAIAKKIVERHGGHIWFDSTPGEGSTFKFSIPATRAEQRRP